MREAKGRTGSEEEARRRKGRGKGVQKGVREGQEWKRERLSL